MSWKPEFEVEKKWYGNAQAFATEEEARSSAHNRFMNWTQPTDFRAVEVPDAENPVNYKWLAGTGDFRLEVPPTISG